MRDKRPTGWTGLAMPLIVAPLVPLALALLPIYLAGRGAYGALLEEWFRHTHAARGRHILFVTSDSPNWQKYIEANILPRLRHVAVVLNWSQRGSWPSIARWEARFFHRFAGNRDFNPIALVMGINGGVRPIRFHRAFLDFRHGNDAPLRAAEAELFAAAAGD